MAHPSDLKRKGSEYSTTSKYVDWVGNPAWKEGYNELVSTGNDQVGNAKMWSTLSATSDEVGSEIYEKISNYISNINDIDTNSLHGVKSYADMIGYDTNMDYLEFVFPLEIAKLLDIFSIKKDILLKTDKVLTIDSRTTMFNEIKSPLQNINGFMDGYVLSGFDQSTQDYIASVSGDPVLHTMLTDDDAYIKYIDDCFETAITDMVLLKYREYESNELPSNDDDPYNYDPTIIEHSYESQYIWKSTINDLKSGRLFLTPNSDNEIINDTKIKYDIPLWFPEKRYVDEINASLRSIDDFTVVEQIVLNLEMDRRKEERNSKIGVSRYFIERENKVKEYFQFLELFNQSLDSSEVSEYSVDTSKFVVNDNVVNNTPTIIDTGNGMNQLSVDVIQRVSIKLRNIALKISYIRESLKIQAQRYYQTGSSLILTELISDYFSRYVYGTDSFWRYDVNNNGSIPSIEKNDNFGIDIIEYTDVTEYMNISAVGDESNPDYKLNSRYWELGANSNGVFDDDQIENFYKNQTNLEFDVVSNGVSGYDDTLKDFFDIVYNSAAVSATSGTLTESTTISTTIDTGNYYLNSDDLTPSGEVDVCPLSDDLFKDGFGDYTTSTSNGLAHEGWNELNCDSIEHGLDPLYSNNTLIVNPSVSDSYPVGKLLLNDVILNEPLINGSMCVLEITYRKNTLGNNHPCQLRVFDGVTYNRVSEPRHDLDSDRTYGTYTTTFTVSDNTNCYLDFYDCNSGYLIYVNSIKIYKLADPSDVTYFVDTNSLTMSSVTTIDTIISPIDGVNVYSKYIGTPDGMYPYANIKNVYHPSYQVHPYMKNFYEIIRDDNPLDNLFKYVTEGYEVDYATIGDRIDEYGNLIDMWRRTSVDFTGYTTAYEESDNLDDANTINELIDVEHPFIYSAISDLYNNSNACISSVQNQSGYFYDTYYKHLKLTTPELNIIYTQLNEIAGDINSIIPSSIVNTELYKVSSKLIYKYFKDQFGNVYTLFKDEDTFDNLGQIWMRKKNHPISFPLFRFGLSDNNRSDTSQIPIGVHDSLKDELFTSNTNTQNQGIMNVYDMGFTNNLIYIVYNNHNEGVSTTPNDATVMFGHINVENIETDNILHPVMSFNHDSVLNVERFAPSLSDPNNRLQYVGTYVKSGELVGVFIELTGDGSFPSFPPTPQTNYRTFSSRVICMKYSPLNYVKPVLSTIHTNYNNLFKWNHNGWRLENTNSILSIVFESNVIPKDEDVVRNLPQSTGDSSQFGSTTYDQMIRENNQVNLYQNGFTTIDYELNDLVTPTSVTQYDVSYFYKNSDVSYYPLYSGVNGYTSFDNNAFQLESSFNIQFFGQPINTSKDKYVYEGVIEPITDLSSYHAFEGTKGDYHPVQQQTELYELNDTVYVWENETDSTDISGYQYFDDIVDYTRDEFHILEDMDDTELDPEIGEDVTSTINIGVVSLINGFELRVWYTTTPSGDVDVMYFASNSETQTFDTDGDVKSINVSTDTSYNSFDIKMINKNECKFNISYDADNAFKTMERVVDNENIGKMSESSQLKVTD